MVFPDDDELVSSTVLLLQGVTVSYKSTLDDVMSFVHGVDYGKDKQYNKGE